MFSAAFKNSLTERRHAVRVAAGVEQMELSEGRDAWLSLSVRCQWAGDAVSSLEVWVKMDLKIWDIVGQ
jgi:hypothetical protein